MDNSPLSKTFCESDFLWAAPTCTFLSFDLSFSVFTVYCKLYTVPSSLLGVHYNLYKLRFVLPCKYEGQPIFGIAQFVSRFTHFKTHFGALSKKQKKQIRQKIVG